MFQALLSVVFFGMVSLPGTGTNLAIEPMSVQVGSLSPIAALLAPLLAQSAEISASGVVVMDIESGQTLYERNADETRPIASLTKLMTALVVLEEGDLNEWVQIPKDLPSLEAKKVLVAGQHFRMGDVLTASLVHSSNEAAIALARHISGSEEAFVLRMNERAKELGLVKTSFENPIGFDAPDQKSSPRDVAWLASYVLRKEEIRSRMSLPSASIQSREGTQVTLLQTHALLTGQGPVVAGKTGTTDAAGECLLSVIREGDRDLLVVLLGSSKRYNDMRLLLAALRELSA